MRTHKDLFIWRFDEDVARVEVGLLDGFHPLHVDIKDTDPPCVLHILYRFNTATSNQPFSFVE